MARSILVAVDFSHCSRLAARKARTMLAGREGKILLLHVIDQNFVKRCIRNRLGDESEIKKALFIRAKSELSAFLHEEGLDENGTEVIVCEGVPFIEINRKAIEREVELIVMGSRGKAGDMNTIFFGSTTEKVLRFITCPVLCVPPETDYQMD